MGKKKSYVGINIQFPISQLIVSGKKTIETRTYPIPDDYVGKEMVLVETPGKDGKFKSRIIAIIQFGPSFKYESKSTFYSDVGKHCVTKDSPWAWQQEKGKWGWPILSVKTLETPSIVKKRIGIKFTKELSI